MILRACKNVEVLRRELVFQMWTLHGQLVFYCWCKTEYLVKLTETSISLNVALYCAETDMLVHMP